MSNDYFPLPFFKNVSSESKKKQCLIKTLFNNYIYFHIIKKHNYSKMIYSVTSKFTKFSKAYYYKKSLSIFSNGLNSYKVLSQDQSLDPLKDGTYHSNCITVRPEWQRIVQCSDINSSFFVVNIHMFSFATFWLSITFFS